MCLQHKLIIILLALCPSGQFWGLCKVPHDNLVCWEIGEYKSCRELMYLPLVKIGGFWPSSLGVTVVQSWITVLLALCLV